MGAPNATRPGTGRLTREAIIKAASELIAEEGFEALTMRRLAERCGVGAMTLYGYFPSKEDLLAALADRALAEVALPADDLEWGQRIAEVFRSVRLTFLEHPELAQIAATQRIDGTAAYRGAEIVFAALEQAGLEGRRAVAAFETLTAYTAGFVLRETAPGSRAQDADERLDWIRSLPEKEFAHVVGLAGMLAAGDAGESFEQGLAILIGGIGALGAEDG